MTGLHPLSRPENGSAAPAAAEPIEVVVVSGTDVVALRRCIGSVRTHLEPSTRIRVWVNRAGTDAEALAAEYPDIDWTLSPVDHGYASAANQLMARGDLDVLLLHADVELRGPLTRTRAALHDGERVAVVAPTFAGAERPWDVAHRAPTVTRVLVERSGLGSRLRGSRLGDRYPSTPDEVDGHLAAGCLLVSRAAWLDVGQFDDRRYFLFGEDRDWQADARARGWRLRLVDEPQAHRDGAATDPFPGASALGAEQPPHRIRDLQRATTALGLGVHSSFGRGTLLTAADIVADRLRSSRRPEGRAGSGSRHPVVITTPRFGLGGAERQRALLANELARRGHPVTVVCLHDLGYLQRELDPDVRLVYRPWWQPFVDLPGGDAVLVSGTTNIEIGFALAWSRVPAGRRRWLVAAHNPPEAGRTYSTWLARAISRSDGVIALSEGHWRELTHDQHLHSRHWNVPNGVELHEDRGFAPRRPLRVGFLGRIVEHKNPHLLVDALAQLSELPWRLDLFGAGPDAGMLQARTPDAVRDRVHWRGHTAGPGPALAEMDVLCLPSRHEAFPLVLLEAMATGVPAMASAVCAVPEMLDHGRAGIVVSEATVEAWVDALRPVLTDPHVLAGIARAGWERVQRLYTVPAMTDQYQAVMAEALARS